MRPDCEVFSEGITTDESFLEPSGSELYFRSANRFAKGLRASLRSATIDALSSVLTLKMILKYVFLLIAIFAFKIDEVKSLLKTLAKLDENCP